MKTDEYVQVHLEEAYDLDAWRDAARRLLQAEVHHEHVFWSTGERTAPSLFAQEPAGATDEKPAVRASRVFLQAAADAILHRDDDRLALLYRLLWRQQREPHLMANAADRDVHRLGLMARNVRRDIHKMRAFVRFRAIVDAGGEDRYVAWFEPEHRIVRRNARFFLNRFASQKWSILTPHLCVHWDGQALHESPGARREDAPVDDATETLWQRYYASIFNPARLKVAMMAREMPRKYWKNLPEARLIPELIAGAQAREATMIDRGADPFEEAKPATLEALAEGIIRCRRCAIGCNGTRAVAGEGPASARIMIVGEQPGDMEERTGRPFVGPAGQLLDTHLERAGLDRATLRVTNAVKHFKFEPRVKGRIHRNPAAGEIDTCRWWLDAERNLVQPQLILALGASAGRALLGRTPSIGRERGTPLTLPDGTRLLLTVHPAYLLRLEREARAREGKLFRQDLRTFAAMAEC